MDVEHVHGESVALVGHGQLFLMDLLRRLLVGAAIDFLDSLRHLHRCPLGRVAGVGDDVALMVEQVALAIVLEDGPVGPTVAMEIAKLRVLRAVVQIA